MKGCIGHDRQALFHYSALFLLLLAWLLTEAPGVHAEPIRQADPAVQCAEGVQLFEDSKDAEALPLLEAGFAGQNQASFTNLDDLGQCALMLGRIRNKTGDGQGALEAYTAALEIFRRSGNQQREAGTLSNLGVAYHTQRQYDKAISTYEQAIIIWRKLGDRAEESNMLSNIGVAYHELRQYDKALTAFEQVLVMVRALEDRAFELETLNNLGNVYQAQRQYEEAYDTYQQALIIVRALGDSAREGQTLLRIGQNYQRLGQYDKGFTAFEQALTIARALGDRAQEGYALQGIGVIYWHQAQYEKARDAYQQALVIVRALGDREGEGNTLHNLGLTYADQGQYDQALDAYQQALTIARALDDPFDEGQTLQAIGKIYEKQGQYQKAHDSYQQVLTIARMLGDRAQEGDALRFLGSVYETQGQYQKAHDSIQQSLTITRALGDRDGESDALRGIGLVYSDQGQYDKALDAYQQSLTITRALGNRAGEAQTLNNLGTIYQRQKQYEEAYDAYEQALAIWRAIGNRPDEGETLNNLGAFYVDQGQYDKAHDTYQQSLTIARALGDRAGEGITLNNLGIIYHNQRQYEKAYDAYQQALVLQRMVGDTAGVGNTLGVLGTLYQAQGQYDKAQDSFQQAMDILEQVRAAVGSEQGRSSFIAQHATLYDRAVALAHQQGKDDLAFYTSERGRARAFLDSLTTGTVQLSDQEAQALLIREQESYTARQNIQNALAKARAVSPPEQALIANLEQQLAAAEQVHNDAQQAVEAYDGQLAALIPNRIKGVLAVADVQALLDPDTTLVSFFVVNDQTLAFVLTRDRFITIVIPIKRDDLIVQVKALRQFANTTDAYPAAAVQLYQWLIAPLTTHLKTPHLAIVPHDVLHYLPFAALTDGRRFLIDDYALTILPSVSSLNHIQKNATGRVPGTPLILGNPATNVANLRPLTFAQDEARAIAGLYGVEPLLGSVATEDALRQQVGQAAIVHLAAHGSFNLLAPLASTVYLAPNPQGAAAAEPDPQHDGRLEVSEIYGLDLHRADLVVLSACQTQIGDLSAGDELVGMTRAFFFAGAPSVIASLWSVNDEATSLLMERFYVHLHAGVGKAEALRLAQIELRQRYPNPYFWSGFVLSGDAGAIRTSLRDKLLLLWPWPTGGVLLVIGVVSIGVVLRRRAKRLQPLVTSQSDHGAAGPTIHSTVAFEEPDDLLAALLAQAALQESTSCNRRPPDQQ